MLLTLPVAIPQELMALNIIGVKVFVRLTFMEDRSTDFTVLFTILKT
jgi:hypothetical protein